MTRRKQISDLKEQIEGLSKDYAHIYEKAMFNGAFLADEPFIPEYLGFEVSEVRDRDDVLMCRVYTKDGFSISRYIDVEKKEWIIVKPGNPKPLEIVISSMEMGIKILQACGMDVSVYQYLTRETAGAETTIPEPA
jgi:hypothetical protein